MFMIRDMFERWNWKRFFRFFMALGFVVIISCSSSQNNFTQDKVVINKQQDRPAMANPAAVKCVNDGYKLVPVIKNGVPVESFCVNPENGKECEVWKYFRGECVLDD